MAEGGERDLQLATSAVPVQFRQAVESAFCLLADREGDDRSWARDWIYSFDSDAAGDITGLSSPLAFQNGLATRIDVVTNVPSKGAETKGAQLFPFCVPVWSMRNLTAGIAVLQLGGRPGYESITSFPHAESSGFYIGRFVQDQVTGEAVTIAGSVSSGMATIEHAKDETSTLRKHTFIHCNRDLLGKKPWSPSSIAAATLLCETSVGDRHVCPVCGLNPSLGMRCGCTVPYSAPTSSLDYSKLRSNGVLSCGMFSSMSNIFVRETQNEPLCHLICPSVIAETPLINDASVSGLCELLRDVALQNRIQAAPVPRSVPAICGAGDAVQSGQDRPGSYHPPDSQKYDSSDGATSLDTPFEFEAELFGVGEDMTCLPPGDGGDVSMEPFLLNIASGSMGPGSSEPSSEPCCPPVSDDDPISVRGTISDAPARTGNCTSDASQTKETVTSGAPENERSASEEGNRSARVDSREVYRLERQRKNRLAAARSNAKRRAYRDGLRRDLEILEARRVELLEKEDVLKKTNLELKEKAADLWVSRVRSGLRE